MKVRLFAVAFAVFILLCAGSEAQTKTITFSGYEWTVVNANGQGPGPNNWAENNVWVDEKGALHLKITRRGSQWYCAKLGIKDKRLGYGHYQFEVIGRVDQLDPNVVLGLFNYPPREIGPDGTHEIDIEFAKWGRAEASNGQYTVWPAKPGLDRVYKRFDAQLHGTYTTHSFDWNKNKVSFQSVHGHPQGEHSSGKDRDEKIHGIASWSYEPEDPASHIGEQPMPVFINLWLFKGRPPTDGKEIEMIVSSFKFTPK